MSDKVQKVPSVEGNASSPVRLREAIVYTDKATQKDKKRTMLLSNVSFYNCKTDRDPSGWNEAKRRLSKKCQYENWGKEQVILHNYVTQLFDAIARKYLNGLACADGEHDEDYMDGLFFSDDDKYLFVNTSLYNNRFEQIYMLCSANTNLNQQPWFFLSWSTNQELTTSRIYPRVKPDSFVFFKEHHELYYTPAIELTINQGHILAEDVNHNRIPRALGITSSKQAQGWNLEEKLAGAVSRMLVRVKQNSRTVVPQYFDGKLQLLLPLSFTDDNIVQLVIPVSKEEKTLKKNTARDPNNPDHWHYVGRTVLDMQMAYNNARLLNRLESEWLRPSDSLSLPVACLTCNPPGPGQSGAKASAVNDDAVEDDDDEDTTSMASTTSSFQSLAVARQHGGSGGSGGSGFTRHYPKTNNKTKELCAFYSNFGKCHNAKCFREHDVDWKTNPKPPLPPCQWGNQCRYIGTSCQKSHK